ncbi:hypothetical protein EDD86DRAFT_249760 [Gorgonomyces haynaldii]|nr:hypothetical protein EDD86DRAFT_249760 [Gorgonomyces haynaldii]
MECPICKKTVMDTTVLKNNRLLEDMVQVIVKYQPRETIEEGTQTGNEQMSVMDLVECPICSMKLKMEELNPHLDNGCQQEQKEETRKPKNSESGLPTHGDRNTLIERYKRYLALYNANLDSKEPVDDKTILKQVRDWERNQSVIPPDLVSKSHDIDPQQQEYVESHMKKYRDEFDHLIEDVKRRKKKR